MKKEKLIIEGMSCEHCKMALRKELSKLDININNLEIGSAEIEFEQDKISKSEIEDAVKNAGYNLTSVISN
ncbi:MAG: heavy metal transport/detoxification protein [Ignavibacteriales bacterium CG12_big_fil_rev_8_21_14_0_65_30_8]|nr:MAG: heavy metal transport/detoxification protein [Ignavibacteriales bacterium CG12_big_fil_rev_8_21_14_0_65_30_8]